MVRSARGLNPANFGRLGRRSLYQQRWAVNARQMQAQAQMQVQDASTAAAKRVCVLQPKKRPRARRVTGGAIVVIAMLSDLALGRWRGCACRRLCPSPLADPEEDRLLIQGQRDVLELALALAGPSLVLGFCWSFPYPRRVLKGGRIHQYCRRRAEPLQGHVPLGLMIGRRSSCWRRYWSWL